MRKASAVRSAPSDLRMTSGGRVDSSRELTLGRRNVALAKPPLPTLFECGQDVAARELVHRVRAHVEEERNLPRIQKDIVSIGHRQSNTTLSTSMPR